MTKTLLYPVRLLGKSLQPMPQRPAPCRCRCASISTFRIQKMVSRKTPTMALVNFRSNDNPALFARFSTAYIQTYDTFANHLKINFI